MPAVTEKTSPTTAHAGWVLYDGECGICCTWVPRWGATLKRAGFEVAPLQADWVTQRTGLAPDTLLEDFRLLRADGQLVSGADAYRAIMSRIWWTRPIAWLISVWPLRALFDLFYRRIAANRQRISKACRLD